MIFSEKENYRRYDEIMTVEQVMDYLAMGKNSVYNLLKNGELTFFKIGRKYRITKKSVQAYVLKSASR